MYLNMVKNTLCVTREQNPKIYSVDLIQSLIVETVDALNLGLGS
jgi:hypothetical protein